MNNNDSNNAREVYNHYKFSIRRDDHNQKGNVKFSINDKGLCIPDSNNIPELCTIWSIPFKFQHPLPELILYLDLVVAIKSNQAQLYSIFDIYKFGS